MLVSRTFNPRLVYRLALPDDCLRPAGTMASADSNSLSPTSRLGLPSQTARQQVSPGKNVDFPCTLASFTTPALDCIGLRCLLPTRPTGMASHEVRVPQVAGLLPASFRPLSWLHNSSTGLMDHRGPPPLPVELDAAPSTRYAVVQHCPDKMSHVCIQALMATLIEPHPCWDCEGDGDGERCCARQADESSRALLHPFECLSGIARF